MGKGFMIQLYMKMMWKTVVKIESINDYGNNKKEQPSQLTSYIIVVVKYNSSCKKGWAGLLCSAFTFYIFS